MWIAGADSCREGWLVVFRSTTGETPRAEIFEKIDDVFRAKERPRILAIDIPIGLPATSKKGGRLADIEARQVLDRRKSSVFPAPSRPVLKAKSFSEAKRIELRNSTPSKKIGIQVFNILDKIRQVDAVACDYPTRIFECHPEVSFWAMNKKAAMSEPKRKSAGLDKRREILVQNKYDLSFLSTRVGSFREHGWDDLVDACAAAWTAERILTDQAVRFPAKPVFDSTGLDMAIWA